MKYRFQIILILIHLSINSQTLKGVLRDSLSNEKLQYANITVKDKSIGAYSNEDGFYNINISKASKNDTLVFTLIGYKNKNIPLFTFFNKANSLLNLSLSPKTESLDQVIISVDNQKYSNKATTISTGKRKGLFSSSVTYGYEVATFVKNEKNKKGKLTEVTLKLKQNKTRSFKVYQTYYRISFYSANSFGYPEKQLNTKDILIKPKKNDRSYKIDVRDKNIKFGKKGIFIGIETIKPEHIINTGSMYAITPTIQYTHVSEKIKYKRFGSNTWSLQNRRSVFKKKFYQVPFLEIKVRYVND